MKRLLGAHCSTAGGVANAPRVGKEIGATAIQIFSGSNQQWNSKPITDEEAQAFREGMKSGGIEVAFSHACYLINLAAPDPEIFRKSVTSMAAELTRADALGFPFVVLHPGAPKEKGSEWGSLRAAEAIGRIFEEYPKARAKIALEITAGQGSSIGRTFEELAQIIEQSNLGSRLCVCFDTCHAFAAGHDISTKEGYAGTWRLFEKTIGMKMLAALHLNDSKTPLGSRLDRHEEIGKGCIGLPAFSFIMNDKRLSQLPMVLETPKGDDPVESDTRNLKILRSLIS